VHHEIVRDADGAIMVDENPLLAKMSAVHEHNKMCCAILLGDGYDGERFANSPNQRKITHAPSLAITRPLSQEHMEILNKAKTHGAMFHATGGKHLNSDEAFICEAQRQRNQEIKDLQEEKERRQLLFTLQEDAKVIMEDKNVEQQGIKSLKNAELLPLISWKLQKKLGKSAMNKTKMMEAWEQMESPEEAKAWSFEEEKELVDLLEEKIALMDTQVGVEANQMVNAIANQMGSLGEAQIRVLEEAIRTRAEKEAALFIQEQQERREQRQNRPPVAEEATMESTAIGLGQTTAPESIPTEIDLTAETPPAANDTAATSPNAAAATS
jgi:NACalpha-BTF3-like transcription factor